MNELQEDCKRDKSVQEDVTVAEVLKLLIKYIICKMNLQKILFLLSFLTFGAADGISAAYMIEKKGVIGEANPLIRFMYASHGSNGVIEIKLWLVIIILYFVWNISRGRNNYWMINGFLFALFVSGVMATGANLMAARGLEYATSSTIITTYLFLVILLTMMGDAIDNLHI
jgi:CBS domain-containing protein